MRDLALTFESAILKKDAANQRFIAVSHLRFISEILSSMQESYQDNGYRHFETKVIHKGLQFIYGIFDENQINVL